MLLFSSNLLSFADEFPVGALLPLHAQRRLFYFQFYHFIHFIFIRLVLLILYSSITPIIFHVPSSNWRWNAEPTLCLLLSYNYKRITHLYIAVTFKCNQICIDKIDRLKPLNKIVFLIIIPKWIAFFPLSYFHKVHNGLAKQAKMSLAVDGHWVTGA